MPKVMLSVMVVGLLVAADTKEEAVKKDLAKMQGEWGCLQHEVGGMKQSEEQIKEAKIQLIVKDDKYKVHLGERVAAEGTIKLDPSKKPAAIDAVAVTGTMEGIYEFDGDKMKICFGQTGGKRPTEFKTKEGTFDMYIVYQKAK